MSNEINLYCDNSGGLYMSDGETCVFGLEHATGSLFRSDAKDFCGWSAQWVADGRSFPIADLHDWVRRGGASLVSTYDSESREVVLHGCAELRPGSTAARYLGADHRAELSHCYSLEWRSETGWTGCDDDCDAAGVLDVEIKGRRAKEVACAELRDFCAAFSSLYREGEAVSAESATHRMTATFSVMMPDGEAYTAVSEWTYFVMVDAE